MCTGGKNMEISHKRISKYIKYSVFVVFVIGLLVAFSNLSKLKENFSQTNIRFFSFSILSALLMYCVEGLVLFYSLRLFDEKIPVLHTLKYSLIINSLGYLVSLGGLTPFATQVYILGYHNIGLRKATLTRILQVVLFNLIFNGLLIVGLLYIILNEKKVYTATNIIIPFFSLLIVLMVCFYLTVFWKKFRTISLTFSITILNRIGRLFSQSFHVDIVRVLVYFDELQLGLKNLLKWPFHFLFIFFITLVDWGLWVSVMYFSFRAINYEINIGYLIAGFSVGQIVGIVSMIPGGAGAMEGSSSLVYNALGIPFETAFAAVLLYRVSFYIIPFILSLPFYFSLKRKLL
jgi:uncharacterized protein (TIRG00374 family)